MPHRKPTSGTKKLAPMPPDLLARAYLDILAREAGAKTKPILPGAYSDAALERLIDDLEDYAGDTASARLRPDLAAVAILMARAIEAEPGLAGQLRRDAPVVVMTIHTPNLAEMAKEVAQECVLPQHSRVLDVESSTLVSPQTRGILVVRDGTAKPDRRDKGSREVTSALQYRIPVMGIAPDPSRHLPQALTRTAVFKLTLPSLDQAGVALVIEAVTGLAPTRAMDPALVRMLDIEDLPLAFRFGLQGNECLSAIEDLVRKRGDYLFEGPSLGELTGYGAAKDWGMQLADDLTEYRAGRLSWADVDHKGLLLSGPPGTGKTQFARALAKTAQVPLVSTSVAEWNSASYLSGTLQAIRDAFSRARRQAPCILFIDEVDGISDRAKLGGDYIEYWTQIVNLLLEQLAAIEERAGVVVVAATNHPDRIDAAVKRAGRLDREIQIEKPNTHELVEIFRFYLGSQTLKDADLVPLAMASRGATGADVEAVVRRAKGTARRARRELTIDDLLAVRNGDVPALSPDARWRIAVHEAGHALAAIALEAGHVGGVSIHPTGGFAEYRSDISGFSTYERLMTEMAVLMAGRAAERLILGDVGAGAGMARESDLGRATALALLIEAQCGLGHSGEAYIGDIKDLVYAPALHLAVNLQLKAAQAKASLTLDRKRGRLEALANALNQEGYLSGDEIRSIVCVTPIDLNEAEEEFA